MNWTCSACGEPARLTNGSYAYRESGLDNITLTAIDLIHCDHCGNEDPMIRNLDGLHQMIAEALISKPARLNGKEVRFLRKYLGKTAREMSKILHVSPSTISKWENGEDPVGAHNDLLIRALLVAKESNTGIDPLLKKLCALDEDNRVSDIIVNPHKHEYEYV